MRGIALVILLLLSVGAPIVFSQPNYQCISDCAMQCAQQCVNAAGSQSCTANCVLNVCCPRCGGCDAGITNPDPCPGTAPSGAAWVWNGATCTDPNAAQFYCGQAATCSACQNRVAYRCIWNGACVPCNAASCSYSCSGGGGGGGGNGGGGGGGGGGGAGDGGNPGTDGPLGPDLCGGYASCAECTPQSSNITLANGRSYYCGWSISRGCLRGNKTGSKDSYGALDGVSSGSDWVYYSADCPAGGGAGGAGGNDWGSTPAGTGAPCPAPFVLLAAFAVFATFAAAIRRSA